MSSRHAETRTRQQHCRRHTPLEKSVSYLLDVILWDDSTRSGAGRLQHSSFSPNKVIPLPSGQHKTKYEKSQGSLSTNTRSSSSSSQLSAAAVLACDLGTRVFWSLQEETKFWGRRKGLLLTPTGAPGSFMWEPQGQGARKTEGSLIYYDESQRSNYITLIWQLWKSQFWQLTTETTVM